MFYIEDENKNIVLFNENKQELENSLIVQPQYKDLPILETDRKIVVLSTQGQENKFVFEDEHQEEIENIEKERIAQLHLTKREVFLGLHKAKNVTPDQIRAQITDDEALIEFDYATEYYRGNPLIDMVGSALGITPIQLDKFFETNDYHELLDPPVEAGN